MVKLALLLLQPCVEHLPAFLHSGSLPLLLETDQLHRHPLPAIQFPSGRWQNLIEAKWQRNMENVICRLIVPFSTVQANKLLNVVGQ